MLEIDNFYSALNINLLVTFFKRLSFKDELRFGHETKANIRLRLLPPA